MLRCFCLHRDFNSTSKKSALSKTSLKISKCQFPSSDEQIILPSVIGFSLSEVYCLTFSTVFTHNVQVLLPFLSSINKAHLLTLDRWEKDDLTLSPVNPGGPRMPMFPAIPWWEKEQQLKAFHISSFHKCSSRTTHLPEIFRDTYLWHTFDLQTMGRAHYFLLNTINNCCEY